MHTTKNCNFVSLHICLNKTSIFYYPLLPVWSELAIRFQHRELFSIHLGVLLRVLWIPVKLVIGWGSFWSALRLSDIRVCSGSSFALARSSFWKLFRATKLNEIKNSLNFYKVLEIFAKYLLRALLVTFICFLTFARVMISLLFGSGIVKARKSIEFSSSSLKSNPSLPWITNVPVLIDLWLFKTSYQSSNSIFLIKLKFET